MIVCKFGGSSLISRKSLNLIKEILNSNQDRKIIVLSAIGKNNAKDIKLTDILIRLANSNNDKDLNLYFEQAKTKMQKFANELEVACDFFNFSKFYSDIKDGCSYNYIVSRGEYYTAMVCSKFLGYKFIDAIDLLIHNGREIVLNKDFELLKKCLNQNKIIVPGFYFADKNNNIQLFNRGGGDVTGAIIANLLKATLYENYTDVNGLLNIDKDILKENHTINELTYSQIYKTSFLGIDVFNKESVPFVARKNIETHVKNTYNYKANYTKINNKVSTKKLNYIFGQIKKCYCATNTEKRSKRALASDIFKVFMSYKSTPEFIYYVNSKLYFNKENYKCEAIKEACFINLVLYGEEQLKKVINLRKVSHEFGLDIYCRDTLYFKETNYYEKNIVFFGEEITELFLKKAVKILNEKEE